MRESSTSLSQAQRQVAAAMLDDPEFALRANVEALAERAGVSPPTITRFCRALGYSGLREFKLRLAQNVLLVQRDKLLVRLEGAFSRERALQVARSLRQRPSGAAE